MHSAIFFLAALAACLFWTAACTAAGVRCERGWLRRLLLGLGLLAPLISLLPWLAATTMLAFVARLEVNWFGPVFTLFLSAVIGGAWIQRAGTQPRGGGWATVPAATWPTAHLAALFVLSKASTAAVLLLLDGTALDEARLLRLEASSLMQANLPPLVADTDNAARRYEAAFVLLKDETEGGQPASPLAQAATVDPTSPAVVDLLRRHRNTLAILRDAASMDVCRFARDWTRPSFDMVLPELNDFRQAARLLQLAARHAAAEGQAAEALQDVCLMASLGQHAANEPLLISGLVGLAIDSMTLTTLTDLLPTLTSDELSLLDSHVLRDMLVLTPTLKRHFFGEEAFGLRTFASFADASLGLEVLAAGGAQTSAGIPWTTPSTSLVASPAMMFYRIFLLPADLACYRRTMRLQQQVMAKPLSYLERKAAIDSLEDQFTESRAGILSSLILPALSAAMRAEVASQMRHQAALVAVAATRMRLEEGRLPDSLSDLVPRFLPAVPRDLFTPGGLLRLTRTDDALTIYSVGPNGTDDGGPDVAASDPHNMTDDVGLSLALSP